MEASDIREMTIEEINTAVDEKRRELFNLRIQAETGLLENSANIRNTRRDIARLHTEVTARNKQNS